MANRYWVGGAGTWDTSATTHWSASSGGASGASVPTAADSVFFDQAGTYTVTMTGALACLDITVSAGTVTFATGTTPTLAVSGSMSLITGTVWSSTGAITFNATTTGKTITTNGVTINGAITLNGVGGGWSLGSAVTLGATLATTLTNGALTLNGFTLTTGTFSSNNANTRSIAFGANNIALATTTSGATNLDMATATNFTWTGTGGFTSTTTTARTFTFGTTGGSATNAPNLTVTGSTLNTVTLTTNSWFKNLDLGLARSFGGTSTINIVGNLAAPSSSTALLTYSFQMVGTGTITNNSGSGSVNVATLTINSTSGTTTLSTLCSVAALNITSGSLNLNSALTCLSNTTFTAGTLTLNGADLTTNAFTSSNTNTRSISFGTNNIVLNATTAATTVLGMATATGFTWTGTGGFTTSASVTRTVTFGTTGGTITNAPNLTLTGSGLSVITFTTGSAFKNLDFGTTSFTVPSTTITVYGDLTLNSGGSFSSVNILMNGTGNLNGNGNATLNTLALNAATSAVTLTAPFTVGVINPVAGSLTLNGFDITATTFLTTGSLARSIAFGSNNINLTQSGGGINAASVQNLTCSGAGGFVTDAASARSFNFGGTTSGGAASTANLTFTGSGTTAPTFTTNSWFKNLDFGTTAFSVGTIILNIAGNLTLSSGGTFTGLTVTTRDSGNLTSNGKTIAALSLPTASTTAVVGALACSGALTMGVAASTLQLPAGLTSSFGSVSTTGTTLKFLTSSTSGTQATISVSTGVVSTTYLSIKDSNATGGAAFQAYTINNNVDAGNNTGWIFSASGGNFLMFF